MISHLTYPGIVQNFEQDNVVAPPHHVSPSKQYRTLSNWALRAATSVRTFSAGGLSKSTCPKNRAMRAISCEPILQRVTSCTTRRTPLGLCNARSGSQGSRFILQMMWADSSAAAAALPTPCSAPLGSIHPLRSSAVSRTPRRTSGTLVMMPSTPSPMRRRISSGSSTVQAFTL